jgi:hypothetical protein
VSWTKRMPSIFRYAAASAAGRPGDPPGMVPAV